MQIAYIKMQFPPPPPINFQEMPTYQSGCSPVFHTEEIYYRDLVPKKKTQRKVRQLRD